jgi:predicted ATPase with chaperone activity
MSRPDLAERVPGLLPDLDVPDALEVTAVHSLAGFNLADELITRPSSCCTGCGPNVTRSAC